MVTKTQVDHELRIKGYRRISFIGGGSFSDVWRGTYMFNDRQDLAIKIVNKTMTDGEFVEKFLPREISNLRQVQHSNFVKIYDIFETARFVYIVMEFCNNGCLENVIDNYGAMSATYCRRIFRQLCHVVKYLHSRSICHRDLKSGNVLLDSNGNVKLADMGFSRDCKPKRDGTRKRVDSFCGTLGFVAPEVIQHVPYCPKAGDIWSLGCILYHMAFGVMPFDDESNTINLTYAKIPGYVKPYFDKDLGDLIQKLLESDPSKRISMVAILSHPWLLKDNGNLPEAPLKVLILILLSFCFRLVVFIGSLPRS